ncbi:T9SS type B sorting domain-containing protein [Lacinutrix venerupis]|uniref:Gliding motility-associated-like protein n=1 Tax=Lacinutrix venerupis TaxID=1486034 RepID=A0AAC9LLR7_9FLAO|nr:T9SS type B sorting domain-containing protein [Lacinutrix venerupis]APX99674.1 hypothetical protein BWR22_04890 [Lacinutrix venerupis]
MKSFYILFLFCFVNVALYAQTTPIPDTNFEQELINQGIDTNGLNGNVLNTDAQSITNLTLAGTNITDITGINAFINLTNLDLGNNQVITVSLTALTQLVSFRTNDNEVLASVDFSQNVLLEEIFIHGNFPYTTLPPITTIDLSQNLNLISFDGDFLNNVTDIIWPITNTLTTIDIRYLADTTLDFSLLSGLEDLNIGGSSANNVVITLPNVFTNLKYLRITSIDIPTIDISNYINLESIYFWGTYVENLLLPNSNTLTDIFIINHDIQNPLDFSVLPNLTDLDITSNQTTPLVVDVTQNILLENVDLSYNDINTIDLTQNINLEELSIGANNLTALDVTQNTLLYRLSAAYNQLPTIDLSQNTILEYLTLSFNLIPTLDVTQNVILRQLIIDNNLFTTTGLDLTQNVELNYINISHNQVESLYILDCIKLISLNISHNLFSGTDILDQLYTVKSNYFGVSASNLIDVSYNNLHGLMPDFASLVGTNANYFRFYFHNNAFEFGHFEDQHNQFVNFLSQTNTFGSSQLPIMTEYGYAPQAKVDVIQTINANAGDAVTLTTVCAGTQNHYTWFKDGVAIPGAPDSPSYTIPSVNSCDQAVYHSEIKSDLVPFENGNPPGTGNKNLLLIRNDITLNVNSPAESCTSLISPVNGSTNIPLNEVLTWTESLGACGYFISMGTTSGATDILNNVDVGNVTSYTTTSNLPPNTQIFITITPYFLNGTVLNCNEESFTTGNTTVIPECTTLSHPVNGDTNQPVSIDLYWNSIANATGYILNVGTTSGATDILNNIDVGLVTTYDFANDLSENETIYVTITPYNSAGNAISCLEESFTTLQTCNVTAETLPDTTQCDNYTLPTLTSGNYFTASGGTGTPLNAGDTITSTQTIYIYETNGSCSDESSFNITINITPTVDILNNQTACDNFTLQALTVGNYFTASGGTGTPLNAGDTINTTQTIYIYETNGNCSNESSFDVTITSTPTVDVLNNQTACDSFTLQPLTVGNYFTNTGGTGTPLNAGDVITTTQTIYIYETNGSCSDESSFDVTITSTPTVDILNNQTVCDSFTLQPLTVGNYFTNTGGTGTPLNPGNTITTTQTIYIYETNGSCSDESSFDVTITTTPTVDVLNNQTACDSFTLQPLTVGNYFTASGGTGTPLNAGDTITSTQTIYIYETNGSCSDESSFDVTITTSPTVDVLNNQTACDSFTLQPLTVGNYFTASGGTGTPLNAGDTITTTQTIYIYETNGSCSDESSFDVTITTTPTVDVLNNQTACDSFTLQPLTVGNYFTASGGTGTPLNAGDTITTTQTIYIYETNGSCSDESSFNITINTTPTVDVLNNIIVCDSYILQNLNNGNYFTQPNGNGTQLNAGDIISTSQSLYIYNEINNCSAETFFNITIHETPTVDILQDVVSCDSFILQPLNNGNYYSAPNGMGTPMLPGENILASQTIYIYAETSTNPNCFNESVFTVTINPSQNFNLTQSNLNIYEGELIVTMNDTSIDYQYSIDGFNYQNNNLFSGLSDGSYTLYVKDTNGCLEKTIDFTIELKQFIIPKFFTPNGDNVNETWDIIDNKNEIKLTSIFNRYGRLLTQLKTTKRWDGTYSGELLPTSDYWYIIELKNGTILKGHFSLVR